MGMPIENEEVLYNLTQKERFKGSPGKNGTYWKLIEGRLVVIFMQSYFRDPSKYPRA